MHDIDHGRVEAEAEFEQWEAEGDHEYLEADEVAFEDSENYEEESLFCKNGEMCEAQETELALELLEVSSEEELEEFLGNIIHRAAGAIPPPPNMRAVGGLLKSTAKKVLPHISRAVGSHFDGAQGARIGSRIAGAAGRFFGLELEGLSGEDQEFELAKAFVRFAGHTARNMSSMAGRRNPLDAARLYAPGLLSETSSQASTGTAAAPMPSLPSSSSFAQSGKWMRKGNKIVLYGV